MKFSVCFFLLSAFLLENGLFAVNGSGVSDVAPAQASVRRRVPNNVETQLSEDQASFFAFYQRCASRENETSRREGLKALFLRRLSANADGDESRFSRLMTSVQWLVNLSSILVISEIVSDDSVRS